MAFRHHIPRKKNAHLLRSLITITVYVNWRLGQTHFLEQLPDSRHNYREGPGLENNDIFCDARRREVSLQNCT
jgi:hypothetical protein